MKPSDILDQPWYDPNNLLDTLIKRLELSSDAALARLLNVAASLLSNMRARRLAIGVSIVVRTHEVSGLSIKERRLLMGDTRESFYDEFEHD
jgi:hypothetical protein